MPGSREDIRKEILLDGLYDEVALDAVHWQVMRAKPDAALADLQNEALEIIRNLAADHLVVLGAMTGKDRSFEPWDEPLEESMRRISDVYINQYQDTPVWIWSAWMELTEKGEQLARSLEQEDHGNGGNGT